MILIIRELRPPNGWHNLHARSAVQRIGAGFACLNFDLSSSLLAQKARQRACQVNAIDIIDGLLYSLPFGKL